MPGELRRWTIECFDAIGRDRELSLALTDDSRLAVRTPPGELAVVTLSGGTTLTNYIAEAQQAAASRTLGQPLVMPTGSLREGRTFYVVDAHGQLVPLGVGLHGTRVAVNGPRWWEADPDVMSAITTQLQALTQTARDERRQGRS